MYTRIVISEYPILKIFTDHHPISPHLIKHIGHEKEGNDDHHRQNTFSWYLDKFSQLES